MSMLDLGNPSIDWVELAKGMGVEGGRATTLEECADLMTSSFDRSDPFLIELVV
jgi:acetolactate synthase-1/2/3 large subunit